MIFWILIFVPGLNTVMVMAQGLPVTLVPEEFLITSVRNDVIDVGCLDILAFLHALYAEGMGLKVTPACSLPCLAVASTAGTPHLLWVHCLVCLAVLLAVGYQRRAAWMTAGCVGSCWQRLNPPTKKSPAGYPTRLSLHCLNHYMFVVTDYPSVSVGLL